jgi:hypothetical protein
LEGFITKLVFNLILDSLWAASTEEDRRLLQIDSLTRTITKGVQSTVKGFNTSLITSCKQDAAISK